MIFEILTFLGILTFILSLYAVISEIQFHKKFSKEMKKIAKFTPSISVLIPTKGHDSSLKDNILSIVNQKYPNKAEYIFILDSKDDPAHFILKNINKKNIKILYSQKLPNCSGKISALLTGLKSAKNDVLVFADTDAKFADDWLVNIVSGLEKFDLTTGYRFYYPDNSFLSYIRCVWSNIGLRLMFSTNSSFAWGGSMAIRKKTFYELGANKMWEKVLSDDISLTNILRKHNGKMIFLPSCMCITKNNLDFKEFREFSNRQYMIVNTYAPSTYKIGSILLILAGLMVLLGIISLFFAYYLPSLLLLSGIIFFMIKDIVAFHFYKKNLKINGNLLIYAFAGLISLLFNFYNLLHAFSSKTIIWKGRTYSIESPNNIKILE